MSRTQKSFYSDIGYPDGVLPLVPGADIIAVTGTGTLTRIAAGEFSVRFTNVNGACVAIGGFSSLLFRTGMQDDLQEFFGSTQAGGAQGQPVSSPVTLSTGSATAGAAVNIAVQSSVGFAVGAYVLIDTVASGVQEQQIITVIPDATHITVGNLKSNHTTPFPIVQNLFTTPAGVSGAPPFAGSTNLTPVTSSRPKGILPKSLSVAYIITGASGITVPTIGLFSTSYANATAPVVNTLITQATNGLQTAAQVTPWVTTVPVPVAKQAYITGQNTVLVAEMDFTEGAANSQIDILGMWLTCSFNYN